MTCCCEKGLTLEEAIRKLADPTMPEILAELEEEWHT